MKRVLVIEDNTADSDYFLMMAKGLCDVDIAKGNLSACKKLQENKYEVLFVDQNLGNPVEEGLEMVLFAAAHKLKLKIVILSGTKSLALAAAARAFKVHLFMEKPVTREVIEKVLLA